MNRVNAGKKIFLSAEERKIWSKKNYLNTTGIYQRTKHLFKSLLLVPTRAVGRATSTLTHEIRNIVPEPENKECLPIARRYQSLWSSMARRTQLQDEPAGISAEHHPYGGFIPSRSTNWDPNRISINDWRTHWLTTTRYQWPRRTLGHVDILL